MKDSLNTEKTRDRGEQNVKREGSRRLKNASKHQRLWRAEAMEERLALTAGRVLGSHEELLASACGGAVSLIAKFSLSPALAGVLAARRWATGT